MEEPTLELQQPSDEENPYALQIPDHSLYSVYIQLSYDGKPSTDNPPSISLAHQPEIVEYTTQTPELVSPGHYRKRHKHELAQIQKMLSVSHIRHPNTGSSDSQYSGVDDSDLSESSKKKSQEHAHQLELYMEFFWCFSCFYSNPTFRKYFERIVIGHNRKLPLENDNDTGNENVNEICHYCNTRFYNCIYRIFFAPIFDNDDSKLTKTQKLVILVRLSFEMYKTMIGSYLTIFTPQKCNEGICTLTQNLIPKDNMEIVALAMNSFMAFALISEYFIELSREKILRLYFENDPRLPVEKEYFTNLLGILDTKKAKLFSEQTIIIRLIFQLYRRIGIILLSIYVANICISGAVIYKNYYDKSSLFGFVTNALFIVFKMASILKIAIHSIKIPYSAYIESPVAFNSLKEEYIKSEIKEQHLCRNTEDYTRQNENAQYFMDNRQYMKFLLENTEKQINYDIELAVRAYDDNSLVDIESINTIDYTLRQVRSEERTNDFAVFPQQRGTSFNLEKGELTKRHHSFS